MTEQLFADPQPTPLPDPGPTEQRTLDDLGQPLHEVTFVVFDVETTGGKADDGAITEIGAVKLRGGECLGTFQTLVNPGRAIPPEITLLTGISEQMVYRAPTIDAVLPSFLEFLGDDDTVLVGHNVSYDLAFTNAALVGSQRNRLTNRRVDTLALARRLLRPEVPNCKLGTLAQCLRLPHQPSHRALDDALATGDLLHVLIERAAGMGVHGLDDLLVLPSMAGHAESPKLRLTEKLPRKPGVYLFKNRNGTVLYVGKAANLRSRVRSYFSTDERRKVAQLLRETHAIDHQVCRNGLEAAVLEVRLIHQHLPRFNSHNTRSSRYPYVKVTLNERFPRLSVVRTVKDDGGFYLGPLSSGRQARRVVDALHTATQIRRCSTPSRPQMNVSPCTAAQIGAAACPCSGFTSPPQYQAIVADLIEGLTNDPNELLGRLARRIDALAAGERFEEAADLRDQADALSKATARQRRFDQLRRAGRVRLRHRSCWAEFVDGRLHRCGDVNDPTLLDHLDSPTPTTQVSLQQDGTLSALTPPSQAEADELLTVARWLERHAESVRLEMVDGVLADPLPRLRDFTPTKAPERRVELRRFA